MSVDSTVSSSIEIQPPSLYPTPVNRDVFKALNKKIDYAMGLLLPDEDIEYLERGTYSMSPAISSINQTDGFTRFIPMFLNVEVKRQDPNSDAKVQLAVWITAEFKKRAEEGYDRNMPVLAVAVYGDDWSLWIAYEPSPEKGSPVQKIVRHYARCRVNTLTLHTEFPGTDSDGKYYDYARYLHNLALSRGDCGLGPNRVLQVVQRVCIAALSSSNS